MYEIKLTISISYDRLYIENNKYMKEWLYIMDSIEEIQGIGKKTKELFNKLGIYTKNRKHLPQNTWINTKNYIQKYTKSIRRKQ